MMIPEAAKPILERVVETGEWRVVGYRLMSHHPDHELVTTKRATSKGKRLTTISCSCGWSGSPTYRIGDGFTQAQAHHLDKVDPPCPTPTKARFRTEAAAIKTLLHVWRKAGEEHVPIRAYECVCTKWHLTSKEDRCAS